MIVYNCTITVQLWTLSVPPQWPILRTFGCTRLVAVFVQLGLLFLPDCSRCGLITHIESRWHGSWIGLLSTARPAIQVSDCNPHTIKILDCTRITRIQNTWLQGFKMGSLSRRELSVTQSRLSTLWNFLVRLLRFTSHNLFLHLHASQCSCQNDDRKSKIICKHNILHGKPQQLIG